MRRWKCSAAAGTGLQDPMRKVVHRAGSDFTARCREQIARTLHREINEEHVVSKKGQHDRECCTLMLDGTAAQVKPQKRAVDDQVVREVREVQKLGQWQIRECYSQLTAGLSIKDLLLDAENDV